MKKKIPQGLATGLSALFGSSFVDYEDDSARASKEIGHALSLAHAAAGQKLP